MEVFFIFVNYEFPILKDVKIQYSFEIHTLCKIKMYHTTSCPWSFRNTSGKKFQNKKIKFGNKNIF